MNDNDLERQLRSQAGPREQGYVPARLPASPDEAPSRRTSLMLRAAVLVPAVAAGVVAVAVAGALLNGQPGPGLGSEASPSAPDPTASESAIRHCTAADLEWWSDPWTGAAGSRGTTLLLRGIASLDACRIDGSLSFYLSDNQGTTLAVGATAPTDTRVRGGAAYEIGLAWSNWCGAAVQPLRLSVTLPGDKHEMLFPPPDGTEIPVPPCNGPSLPSHLSPTDLQPAASTPGS
ncbi:MAG TPA: hypothetical protein VHU77_09010 [Candidatus Limnocylindria bacterium]|jgi:hypothetical protein|nr:hypothetical protein [Candidatus Limnocylindria bacterium]